MSQLTYRVPGILVSDEEVYVMGGLHPVRGPTPFRYQGGAIRHSGKARKVDQV